MPPSLLSHSLSLLFSPIPSPSFPSGGDLSYHLEKEGRFQLPRVRLYLAEIALALEYLRERRIIHRDVKPANMLLDSQGHIHLTDFNVACIVRPDIPVTSTTGTKPYMGMGQRRHYTSHTLTFTPPSPYTPTSPTHTPPQHQRYFTQPVQAIPMQWTGGVWVSPPMRCSGDRSVKGVYCRICYIGALFVSIESLFPSATILYRSAHE